MSITKITDPASVPAAVVDYQGQNIHTDRLLGNVTQPFPIDGSNIKKGSLFNIGGDMFYTDADTAITGTPSDYVKLTVTGTDAAPSFVASLTGVTWNDAYNGYYNVGGDLHVFDEIKAVLIGAISGYETRIGKAFETIYTTGISMKGASNVDRNIEFASDADLLWDESEDAFDFNKRVMFKSKRITSDNYIHAVSTENDIFDKLNPFIPNIGDEILVSGAIGAGSVNLVLSRAGKTSSTRITLYYMAEGSLVSLGMDDGSSAAITISISW